MLFCSFAVSVSAEETVDCTELHTVDRSKFECVDDIICLSYEINVSDIIDRSGDLSAVVIDMNGNVLDAEASVPNGAYLATVCNGAVADKVQICLMEDVNCDGKVTAADARAAMRCGAQLVTLNMIQQLAADVNKDGKVTSADARIILRKPAGLA